MLPEKVLEILAIDLGLLIITAWFVILLLMFHEFRTVTSAVNRLSGFLPEQNNKHFELCQQSVNDALESVNSHTETLNQLTNVHEILEAQLRDLHKSQALTNSKEDEEKINKLEKELDRSHALIKKLKGELISSKKRLEHTKVKLYKQYETVENLQREKNQFTAENEQLLAQMENDEEKMQLEKQINRYAAQQTQLVELASDYKSKLAKQGKELTYLRQKNQQMANNSNLESNSKLDDKVKQLEQQVSMAEDKARQIETEKQFLESKFLDAITELDKYKKN
ncbi:hypothetical protein [Pseudoalteromonas tunicata]|uniref:hypothetical protein n=1 Tax=Pseudoalteromonas tunicata TaxID=314281 RepID=UPI00274018CB|nr:hypothetical protein [Pseudoalteromonas tunicata]MDP4982324.1 hypothetical protein [Pseudoalteromonas tunicata]MDP5211600.1 hypothetical protein [Pseudoalteromonas tunicata]